MHHHVPRPSSPTDQAEAPTAWAGGRQVAVPGLGVGRVLREHAPRVVEVRLGAPVAGVFLVDGEAGSGADGTVILADPDVAPEQLARLIASGEGLHSERVAVQRTPRIPWPRRASGGGGGRGAAYAATVWIAGVAAAVAAGVFGADSDRMIDADGPRVSAEAVTALPTAY